MKLITKVMLVGLITTLVGTSLASAAVDPVAVLKKQITSLQAQVKKLTATNVQLTKSIVGLKTQVADKDKEIKILRELVLAGTSSSGTSEGSETSFDGKFLIGTEQIVRVPANPEKGFNYPYYLWIPPDISKDTYMMVESNNTGRPSDDFNEHETSVKNSQLRGQTGGQLSGMLHIPLLMPVFPRTMAQSMVYTHDLDRDTLALDGGPMKRLDLQLVAMIKHAQGLFKDNGVPVKQKVLMTGFSASAKFATKFAALHPDVVHALSAGGVNGVSILPVSSLKNRVLRYPVGVSDMKELTGEPFDVESYKKVRQFIFMGAKDTNDITEFRDAFDEVDAQLTWDVLGRDMLGVRWPAYQKVLKDVGAAVQFHTYSGIGHQFTNVTMDDQVKFFKANMGETFKVIVPNVKGI